MAFTGSQAGLMHCSKWVKGPGRADHLLKALQGTPLPLSPSGFLSYFVFLLVWWPSQQCCVGNVLALCLGSHFLHDSGAFGDQLVLGTDPGAPAGRVFLEPSSCGF